MAACLALAIANEPGWNAQAARARREKPIENGNAERLLSD